jgi:RecJ-like exonuclease
MTESPMNLQAFFDRIVHGKAEHRAWLKQEFEDFWKITVAETLTQECKRCKGKGQGKHFECVACDGTGRVKL